MASGYGQLQPSSLSVSTWPVSRRRALPESSVTTTQINIMSTSRSNRSSNARPRHCRSTRHRSSRAPSLQHSDRLASARTAGPSASYSLWTNRRHSNRHADTRCGCHHQIISLQPVRTHSLRAERCLRSHAASSDRVARAGPARNRTEFLDLNPLSCRGSRT